MKKETLMQIILGTIGGLVFSIGMCMCLITEWNLLTSGIITSIIGFLILLSIIPIYRKEHPKKKKEKETNWGLILTWTVGIIGSLIMGFGMSKIMIETTNKMDMIIGLITGVIGLLICILNYPIYTYIKTNHE